jgi:chromate transporter
MPILDAIAVGRSPRAVVLNRDVHGYLLGALGSLLSDRHLPCPAFVAISGPLVRACAPAAGGAFLDGVNAASLAVMAAVTAHLASAGSDGPTVCWRSMPSSCSFRLNSTWLVWPGRPSD